LCHSRESGNPEPRHVRPSLDARFRGHETDVYESPHFERLGPQVRVMRAEERQPEDEEARVEMTGDRPEMPDSLAGGCVCGAVRYRISAAPIAAALCHCDRCRPQSGNAFSTVIIIRRSTIKIEGETAVFDDIGSSGLHVARRYCPRCGSPLTTEPDVTPDLMFVKAGGIDSNEWFHPVMELFVGRRRPWVAPVPGAQQLEGNPPI
jgi:hypothetical protein